MGIFQQPSWLRIGRCSTSNLAKGRHRAVGPCSQKRRPALPHTAIALVIASALLSAYAQQLPAHLTGPSSSDDTTGTSTSTATAAFNLLHNGGFERPGLLPGLVGATVSTSLNRPSMPEGWEVEEGSVAYVSEKMWAAREGRYSVGLTGQARGGTTLTHNVSIRPNEFYVLAFDMAADPGTRWRSGIRSHDR